MFILRYSFAAMAIMGLCACNRAPDRAAVPNDVEASPIIPELPMAEPPLDREKLILAAMRAGSASAVGQDDRESQRLLDGKRFELRMRFGCSGASTDSDETRRWSFDEKGRILRVQAEPEISASTQLLKSLPLGAFEAAEGFWITQPWVLTAACIAKSNVTPAASQVQPMKPAVTAGITPSMMSSLPSLGIVQLFSSTDTRTHRRDNRAYKATKPLGAEVQPSVDGYDLLVSGRLKRIGDGAVISCRSEDERLPPSCIIFAEFDRVSLVQPGTGEILAEWAGV